MDPRNSGLTTKEGLLWRNGKVITLPGADQEAMMRGFWCAEQLVRALEAGQPTPVVRPDLVGRTTLERQHREARELLEDDPYASEDEEPPRTRFTPVVAALALGVLLGVAFMLVVTYGIH